jgi:hypothetical protein
MSNKQDTLVASINYCLSPYIVIEIRKLQNTPLCLGNIIFEAQLPLLILPFINGHQHKLIYKPVPLEPPMKNPLFSSLMSPYLGAMDKDEVSKMGGGGGNSDG